MLHLAKARLLKQTGYAVQGVLVRVFGVDALAEYRTVKYMETGDVEDTTAIDRIKSTPQLLFICHETFCIGALHNSTG